MFDFIARLFGFPPRIKKVTRIRVFANGHFVEVGRFVERTRNDVARIEGEIFDLHQRIDALTHKVEPQRDAEGRFVKKAECGDQCR